MAWCHQATSHYLIQCWPKSICHHMASLGHNELNGHDSYFGDKNVNCTIWYIMKAFAPGDAIKKTFRTSSSLLILGNFDKNAKLMVDSYIILPSISCGYDMPLGNHIDGLVQDCSNSSALAVELLQFCTKPSICTFKKVICQSQCDDLGAWTRCLGHG